MDFGCKLTCLRYVNPSYADLYIYDVGVASDLVVMSHFSGDTLMYTVSVYYNMRAAFCLAVQNQNTHISQFSAGFCHIFFKPRQQLLIGLN